MPLPKLSQRTIVLYNRLSRQVAVMVAAQRERNSAAAATVTVQLVNEAHSIARRVYAREPDMPLFAPLLPDTRLTHYDMRLLIQQLLACGMAFEERYYHLSAPDGENLSPHRRITLD